tara:strand:- start:3473 stop:4006 length:534 start_codon:yes stop_codon:yes gene_type:complete
MSEDMKERHTTEYEGNYVLKDNRLYDTATYERDRKSSKYGVQVTWDKSKKSQDILELPDFTEDGERDINGRNIYKQSENGFHFYGTNFCCWRAHPDPHRVMQEIMDYTLSFHNGLWESHLEDLKEGKAGRYGCFSIQLYMVPGANKVLYHVEQDKPIVHGSIFIGSFHVSGIEGDKR